VKTISTLSKTTFRVGDRLS